MYKKHTVPSEYRQETSYKSSTFNFRKQIAPCSRFFLGELKHSLTFQENPFLLEHEETLDRLQEPAIWTLKPSQFRILCSLDRAST